MRAPFRATRVGLALVAASSLAGCSAWQGLVDPAGHRLAQARTALEQHDLDGAYRQLMEIRERYPDSPESREAFRLAAAIFQHRYFQNRLVKPDSPWVTSEPGSLLEWFASFAQGPEFPQAEAEALFVGMPYGFFREYLALAESRPELSRWAIQAHDDDGIVETVTAGVARR